MTLSVCLATALLESTRLLRRAHPIDEQECALHLVDEHTGTIAAPLFDYH